MRARYPEMSATISQVANLRVRSVGTRVATCASPRLRPGLVPDRGGRDARLQRAEASRRISAGEFLTGLRDRPRPWRAAGRRRAAARPERTGISHLDEAHRTPVVTVTALVTLTPSAAVAQARLIVGSVASVPFAADTGSLLAPRGGFGARAEACAEAAAAACTPLPDGEASPDYLSHLVRVHARQALGEAFAAARPAPADLQAARNRTIPDVLPPPGQPLHVLFCEITRSLDSAATGWVFARPGNRFWWPCTCPGSPAPPGPVRAASAARPRPGHHQPGGPRHRAASELDAAELRLGGERLLPSTGHRPSTSRSPARPLTACVRARPSGHGPQPNPLGGSRVRAPPNPSGLDAHWTLDAIAAQFAALRSAERRVIAEHLSHT